MTCALARETEADGFLSDPGFLADWRELQAHCPWATAFQSPEFVGSWYRVYGGLYEPVLVFRRGADGRLDGLLCLAVSRSDDRWLIAGAAQAEYQAWLAHPEAGNDFIEQALTLLFERCAVDRLRFLYLPSAAPLEWIGAKVWRGRSRLAAWHRPLMSVVDKTALSRSLAKKGNRSRLNRLKRLGKVRLEEVTERTRLAEVIDGVADLCDFRHGAAHDVLPFRADPRRCDFYLELMESVGLFHVSLLWAGDRLVGGHLGLQDRRTLYNGLLIHSPFEARHSPGKLHVMLLASRLAETGFRFFDLTPGDDPWKDRFATDSDTVHELVLHRRAARCWREKQRLLGKKIIGQAIRAAGLDPSQLRRRVIGFWAAGLPGVMSWIMSRRRYTLYAGTGQVLEPSTGDDGLRFDDLAHLSNHAAAREGAPPANFMARALERIERGHIVCSAVSGTRLVVLAWIVPAGTEGPRSLDGAALEIPEHCALVELEVADPESPRTGQLRARLGRVLERALSGPGAKSVLVKSPAKLTRADQDLRALGLIRIGEGGWRRTLGLERAWVRLAPLQSPAPAAPVPLVEIEEAVVGGAGRGAGQGVGS